MILKETLRIAAAGVCSLVWSGDSLVDWVAGGRRLHMDGTIVPSRVNFAYRFDAACESPCGEYAVLYERLGTKGLLLQHGKILREINRSFYCAHCYEFPVAFARLSAGQTVLIHCPDTYNRLEIDDAATGERLTKCESREPADYFHSRLACNSSNALLLSTGWIWHPFDTHGVYRLEEAIADPRHLDQFGLTSQRMTETSSAAFLDDDHLVLSTSDESFADAEDLAAPDALHPNSLAVWDLKANRLVSQVGIAEPAGTLLPIDSRHVVGFHEHPKLFDLQTGEVVSRLPHLPTGQQTSSIIHHLDPIPPLALDPQRRRFAVATATDVRVVQILPPH